MANSRDRRSLRRLLLRLGQSPQVPILKPPIPQKSARAGISKLAMHIPGKILGGIALIASLAALAACYPFLSIQPDFSFDSGNPFATSFSVANEGLATATHLSAVCSVSFTIGTNVGSDVRTVHPDFAAKLTYKHTQSLPCAKDARFDAGAVQGAKLRIEISYGLLGISIHRPQVFNFTSERAPDATYHWTYQD